MRFCMASRPPRKYRGHQLRQVRVRYNSLASTGSRLNILVFGKTGFCSIANEGSRLGGSGRRAKREGIVCGVADLCLAMPRKGFGALYIELKRPGCYQRPSQRTWQKNIEKHGNKYCVVKSVDQFMEVINNYLK